MKDKSYYIGNVADVVHSWMNYIYEVSDTKHLAAESSLRYPIAGLLERKKGELSVFMETEHPNYHDAHIDFMWHDGKDTVYLEMKYVKDETINVQEFYDDIFRLASISGENCHRYFLVCGKKDDFRKNFERRQINTPNSYSSSFTKKSGSLKVNHNSQKRTFAFDHILSFEINQSTIESTQRDLEEREFCFAAKRKFYKFYQEFKKVYIKKCQNEYTCPKKITIRTRLIQPINKGLTSSVAIWEIEQID